MVMLERGNLELAERIADRLGQAVARQVGMTSPPRRKATRALKE